MENEGIGEVLLPNFEFTRLTHDTGFYLLYSYDILFALPFHFSCPGCEVEIKWNPLIYKNLVTNSVLAEIYQHNAAELGVPYLSRAEQAVKPGGSTDMGNVSHVKPAIHPRYYVADVVGHTPEFQVAAGTEKAHLKTLIAAKSMARTCLQVFCDPMLMEKINNEFQKSVASQEGEL